MLTIPSSAKYYTDVQHISKDEIESIRTKARDDVNTKSINQPPTFFERFIKACESFFKHFSSLKAKQVEHVKDHLFAMFEAEHGFENANDMATKAKKYREFTTAFVQLEEILAEAGWENFKTTQSYGLAKFSISLNTVSQSMAPDIDMNESDNELVAGRASEPEHTSDLLTSINFSFFKDETASGFWDLIRPAFLERNQPKAMEALNRMCSTESEDDIFQGFAILAGLAKQDSTDLFSVCIVDSLPIQNKKVHITMRIGGEIFYDAAMDIDNAEVLVLSHIRGDLIAATKSPAEFPASKLINATMQRQKKAAD